MLECQTIKSRLAKTKQAATANVMENKANSIHLLCFRHVSPLRKKWPRYQALVVKAITASVALTTLSIILAPQENI